MYKFHHNVRVIYQYYYVNNRHTLKIGNMANKSKISQKL